MRFSRLAGAALAGALTFGAAIPAQSATTPGWRQVLSKHYGVAADYSLYGSVVAVAKNDAWALGGSDGSYGNGTTQETVAEHWNGKTWSAVAMPAGTAGYIDAASAASASSIWAVTFNGGYILRWNGSKWSVAKHLTGLPGELTGVTAVSPSNVWVFGGPGSGPGFGTYHYNGKTWQQVTAASKIGLENGSALSATSIWAIGSLNAPYDSIYHYNGKTWQHVTATALSGLQLNTVKAYSSTNIWITAIDGSSGVLVHYNGKTWTRYKLPWAVQPGHFAPDGHGGLWLTGFSVGSSGAIKWYFVHRTAAGAWSRVNPGVSLTGVALTPGTTSLWGSGSENGKTGSNAVILADGVLP